MDPAAFDCGEYPPDGGPGWEVDGEFHPTNPKLTLTPADWDMLSIWQACRPRPGRIGGMAAGIIPASTHLPQAGGVMDQAAIMLDALDAMDRAWWSMQKEE
ncbi:hypothetical protein [Nitrospirillum iridis]|uniref:Uncharacterized protein n=1 Tax=Nitrospirillum iridis TaxID=765888 RepID=A0A7X0ECT4_9PROT|nr:hypothetical protein [Nitrospirillum iridis]MBB6251430.1 hypothetical protein [Nitrospirillum iridis]